MLASPASPRFDLTLAGEINLDLILYGLPADMPLERELLASGFELTLGSSSAILAHNLAVLGSRVGFVTRVGQDPMGTLAMERLAHPNLDLSRTQRSATCGTGVTLLLPHGHERHILTYPGTMAEMDLASLDLTYLSAARHFHLSSLFLQTALQPETPSLFRALKHAGLTLSLDTNDDPADQWSGPLDELLGLVDLLLPNESEALRMTRTTSLDAALDILAARVPLVVVKCGARGAIVQQGSTREHVAPLTVTPVDTIGAGDSFNAGFLHAWLQGEPPNRAAALGNVTGALSTQRRGGTEAFRDQAFLTEFLAAHSPCIAPNAKGWVM